MKIPPSKKPDIPPVDPDAEYVFTLIDIEERENVDAPPRYTQDGREMSKANTIWKGRLTTYPDGEAVMTPGKNGVARPYELWYFTSMSTYFDASNPQMTSRGRKLMHCLVGHELTDDEVTELVTDDQGNERPPFDLCDRSMLVTLRSYESNGRQRLTIDEMRKMPTGRTPSTTNSPASDHHEQPKADLEDLPF